MKIHPKGWGKTNHWPFIFSLETNKWLIRGQLIFAIGALKTRVDNNQIDRTHFIVFSKFPTYFRDFKKKKKEDLTSEGFVSPLIIIIWQNYFY